MGFLANLFKSNKFNLEIQSETNMLKPEDSDIIENNDKNIAKQEKSKEDETKKDLCLEHNMILEENNYEYPPIKLINYNNENSQINELDTKEMAIRLQNIFNSFKISVNVQNIVIGPTTITYEIELGIGINIANN